MNPFLPLGGWGRNRNPKNRKSRGSAKRRPPRLGRLECLEDRRLLTWIGTFANGQLTITGQGLSSDTGVLKVDPNTQEILLQGSSSSTFVDTGANLATLTNAIQIQAQTTVNSNFIIDNNAGAFFEAPSNGFFAPGAPLFNYTGSSALNPNTSLTIRGTQGVADTFEVALANTSNGGVANINGISTGLAGTVALTQPPNALNQQNKLIVTFGPNALTNNAGVTGTLSLDGEDGPSGNDQLYLDDQGMAINPLQAGFPTGTATATNWTLNGNTIQGPQFPPSPTQVPPVPKFANGTVGSIGYNNIANVQFNDNLAGDLLTINSVAANTTASTAVKNYTVVNYNQPLAYPINLVGIQNAPAGVLNIAGAVNGGSSIYVSANSVSMAATGTKPQYNAPFTHLGADLTYTSGSVATMNVAGNGGNNIVTVQAPPTLNAPYTSDTLPANFAVFGGSLPPLTAVLPGAKPINVSPGTTLLRVFGNAPNSTSSGADSISVSDFAGGNNNNNNNTGGANNIQMSAVAAVVLYGEGGNDTLTNNAKTGPNGQPAVPALFIPGNGNSTLVGGQGSDMFLGGSGQYTMTSNAAVTAGGLPTTYFFPHQDQFGNIYDPLLDPTSVGDTTSTLNGSGGTGGTTGAGLGNQVVVTGAVDPLTSVAPVNQVTGLPQGDLDLGSLSNSTTGTNGGGNTPPIPNPLSYPTVPPSNVTAPQYEVTNALLALEHAMGIGTGSLPGSSVNVPANAAAVLEFGGNMNLRTQFASPEAFVGRAYNDFLVGRGGGGTFGSVGNGSAGSYYGGPPGTSVVGPNEIKYYSDLIKSGVLNAQQMQAFILSSDELRSTFPTGESWAGNMYTLVTGAASDSPQVAAEKNYASMVFKAMGGDTPQARFAIALQLLNSPAGQTAEINDAYVNVVPGASSASISPSDLAAIKADLAAGESLPQVAQVMGQSRGDYLNYELTNRIGTVGFVAGVYQSVLHRAASANDLNYWAAQSGAGVSNATIALTVLNSAEAKSHLVANTYQQYLGRSPSPTDMNFWVRALTSGLSDRQFVSLVVSSNEYYAKNGGTDPGYITGLYRDLLQRPASSPPSQQDIGYWVTIMAASQRGAVQARADVAIGFQGSPEYEALLINGWYQSFFGRAPSNAELNAALLQFNAGATEEQVAAQILVSHAASG